MNNFSFPYSQVNIERIDEQIKQLEELRRRAIQPIQPIQNIINTQTPPNFNFEACILNGNEEVEEILVQHKTAFISPNNGYLKIKEVNGDITTYNLTKPKTPEEEKIEELERRLKEYESGNNTTNFEVNQPPTDDIKADEPSTKGNSRNVSKKS